RYGELHAVERVLEYGGQMAEPQQDVEAAVTPVVDGLGGLSEVDPHLRDVAMRSVPLGAGGKQCVVVLDLRENEGAVPDERCRLAPAVAKGLDAVSGPGKERELCEQVGRVRPWFFEPKLERASVEGFGRDTGEQG